MPHRRTVNPTINDKTVSPWNRRPSAGIRPLPVLLARVCAWALTVALRPGRRQEPQRACLDCHSDKTLTKTNAAGKEVSLFVDEARLKATVHKTNTCAGLPRGHHLQAPGRQCAGAAAQLRQVPRQGNRKDYATSIHGVSHKLGASGAASCWDCHGSHDMLPPKDPDSPVFKLNLPGDLRQMPQQPRADAGIPDEVSPGGGAVHGQHPRARLAQDGPHRRPLLQ